MKHIFLLLATSILTFGFSQNKPFTDNINLSHYDYPYEAKVFAFESQNQELKMIYMDVEAKQPNGKTVLLLHGKNFNAAYWRTTIDSLTNSGFRVIAPDQIGFGKSTKPLTYQYTFQQLAMNTKALLDELGIDQVNVLGHSMGGMLATRFALMYPEITSKLILENPIGLEDWKLVVPYKPVEWWYHNELKKNYEKIKKYQLESYYDGKWKTEYDEWVNVLAAPTTSKDYHILAWNAALTYDMIFTQPVLYEFNQLEMPVLLIIGTRDRTALGKPLVSDEVRATMGLYKKLGRKTKKEIKDCQLVEIENIGHLPHIESFGAFITPLIEFLD